MEMAANLREFELLVEEVLHSLPDCSANGINDNNITSTKPMGLEVPTSSSSPKKQKRVRTIFTPHQLVALEKEFRQRKYLDRVRRSQLAEYLGLSERQIKVWFQNKRMKLKKNPQPEPTPVAPVYQQPLEQPNPYENGYPNFHQWYNQNYYPPQQQYVQSDCSYNNFNNNYYPPQQFTNGWGTTQNTHYG